MSMPDRKKSQNRLLWALFINLTFLVVELVGGLITHSLALLADAGHMVGDVSALTLSLVVLHLARRAPTGARTYGLLRAEVLGALINGAGLLVISTLIFMEAWQRLGSEPAINGPLMLIIALLGLAANLVSVLILKKDRHDDINIRGAFLHMMADSLGSVAVVAAGLVIWLTGWYYADIVASVAVGGIILWNTWGFLQQTLSILLEGTPEHIDFDEVKNALMEMPHVVDVHDLHIWTITSGLPILTVHLSVSDECVRSGHWTECRKQAEEMVSERFGISHSTIQMERCESDDTTGECRPGNEEDRV